MKTEKFLDWLCKQDPTAAVEGLPDRDVWALAALSVIMAGRRAQATGRKDIERVCFNFVKQFAKVDR